MAYLFKVMEKQTSRLIYKFNLNTNSANDYQDLKFPEFITFSTNHKSAKFKFW